MKEYERLEMEVIKLEAEDIVTESTETEEIEQD